eukprot:g18515.t2
MRPTNKRQLPMHLDKGLTRGDQRDSFFTKLSPVCELSLDGEQGPFSTSVKPNTSRPSWDDSVEFEARHPLPLSLPAGSPKGNDEEKYDDHTVLPPTGPMLSVVCYTRSSLGKSAMAVTEIGRAEMILTAMDGGGGGGDGDGDGNSPNRVHRIPLTRRNASGDQVAAGSVTLEYMLVPGIPRPPSSIAASTGEEGAAERKSWEGVPEARAAGPPRRSVLLWVADALHRPPRKPALLALVGALVAGVLAVRLGGVRTAFPEVELSPIPVPFRVPAGRYKGSNTHHVRLHEDGNIVVAMGPKPLPPPAVEAESASGAGAGATATATTLWQSGPLRVDPESPSGGDGGGSSQACKKCQVRVGEDGRVVLIRERRELATFSPLWVEAFFEVLPPPDKR